jgi:hypothetical protein
MLIRPMHVKRANEGQIDKIELDVSHLLKQNEKQVEQSSQQYQKLEALLVEQQRCIKELEARIK